MRPDQDPRLTEMGMSQATCEKCLMELYSTADSSVCDDCQLNPMKQGDPAKFIEEAITHEGQFTEAELLERFQVMNGATRK